MSFAHLHTHSHYSLLEALPQVGDLVKAAKENGATAVALTDLGNMSADLKTEGESPVSVA
jgi:DNA polymerase-3 subunit alpha